MKKQTWLTSIFALTILTILPTLVAAQKIDCQNEYRSGKLYFSQYSDAARAGDRAGEATTLLNKAIEHYTTAVENCPHKDAEYRWNFGIALAESGMRHLLEATVEPDPAAKRELLGQGQDLVARAGREFDAVPETENGSKKKQLKKTRENRLHFWTELYNHGLKRAKSEDFDTAAKYMEAAVSMAPLDVRAYRQRAVMLFNADRKAEAADVVNAALNLEIDPENQVMTTTFMENKPKLEELRLSLFSELGREAANRAKESKNLDELQKAIDYYSTLVGAQPDNPNHVYSRGLAHMTGGEITKDVDSTACVEHYRAAALDMEKAAAMVPADGDNAAFHLSAVKAAMYACRDAGEEDKAFALNLEYACLEPLKVVVWRGLARTYVAQGDQDSGLACLMMSKSLGGTDVPVDIAVTNATDDAKAAVAELGNPGKVTTYQEGENNITTFIWVDQKIARHYSLGKIQQEVTWCQ